jgi:hypothetical protein
MPSLYSSEAVKPELYCTSTSRGLIPRDLACGIFREQGLSKVQEPEMQLQQLSFLLSQHPCIIPSFQNHSNRLRFYPPAHATVQIPVDSENPDQAKPQRLTFPNSRFTCLAIIHSNYQEDQDKNYERAEKREPSPLNLNLALPLLHSAYSEVALSGLGF